MSPPRGRVNEQIDWLKADLAAVDRSKTPWVLAFAHRPYYVAIGDARCVPCQQAFENIFYEGNVDIMMNGHGERKRVLTVKLELISDHVYSRSWPVYNSECLFVQYLTHPRRGHHCSEAHESLSLFRPRRS